MRKSKKDQAGFTLIELAIIIAVLGILGAVGAVKLTSLTDEAKEGAKRTVVANARSALAIAIAKDELNGINKDGKVEAAELVQYLQGATFADDTITVEGYELEIEGTNSDIQGIKGVK